MFTFSAHLFSHFPTDYLARKKGETPLNVWISLANTGFCNTPNPETDTWVPGLCNFSFSPCPEPAGWDHLRALLSCAETHSSCIVLISARHKCWVCSQVGGSCMCMRVGAEEYEVLEGKGWSMLIFINPVIKTKDGAVPFKSVLSGIHQVQTPLPVWGRSCNSAKLRRAAKCEILLLWLCAASWNHQIAGDVSGPPNWRPLFALCPPKPPSVPKSWFDWVRGEIQGVLCLLCALIPGRVDYASDSIPSKQRQDSIIRGFTRVSGTWHNSRLWVGSKWFQQLLLNFHSAGHK